MKQRLLILGSLREFVQLIQLAKSRGIYTIVCDGYPDSEAKNMLIKPMTSMWAIRTGLFLSVSWSELTELSHPSQTIYLNAW